MARAKGMPVVEALQVLAGARGSSDIVITNQASSRVWPQISQQPLDLAYNPSTMGGAIPLALGLALTDSRRQVIVVSGDGALLMNLGCLVTIVGCQATNLTVVVMENGLYEITGGQQIPAAAANVQLSMIAAGAGFPTTACFEDVSDWRQHASEYLAAPGPRFISLRVQRTPSEYLTMQGASMSAQLTRLRAALRDSAALA